jgi:NAD(P)-dependent dehydrogenase (short-subunit alcohol dehydrogenase family)
VLVQADLREPLACQRAVDTVAAEFGRLDILINMASTFRSVAFDDLTVDDWEADMRVDLRASWLCARAAVPHMRRQGRGHIINFSDWVAATGRPNVKGYMAYYVAKTGVIGLTQALALELAAYQILVNAIAPGPIAPSAHTSEARIAREARAVPLGRWGGETQIAAAVVGLLRNDFVSGETLRVDGGRHLTELS